MGVAVPKSLPNYRSYFGRTVEIVYGGQTVYATVNDCGSMAAVPAPSIWQPACGRPSASPAAAPGACAPSSTISCRAPRRATGTLRFFAARRSPLPVCFRVPAARFPSVGSGKVLRSLRLEVRYTVALHAMTKTADARHGRQRRASPAERARPSECVLFPSEQHSRTRTPTGEATSRGAGCSRHRARTSGRRRTAIPFGSLKRCQPRWYRESLLPSLDSW